MILFTMDVVRQLQTLEENEEGKKCCSPTREMDKRFKSLFAKVTTDPTQSRSLDFAQINICNRGNNSKNFAGKTFEKIFYQ